jgi:hypothetical protein
MITIFLHLPIWWLSLVLLLKSPKETLLGTWRTYWEHQKLKKSNPTTPPPLPPPPYPYGCMFEPSHWLHENFIPKIGGHPFWPRLTPKFYISLMNDYFILNILFREKTISSHFKIFSIFLHNFFKEFGYLFNGW